jgi:hypothetical protein
VRDRLKVIGVAAGAVPAKVIQNLALWDGAAKVFINYLL